MRMVQLIEKKQAGQALTQEEINFIVNGFAQDEIPDYQMSALLMAIYFKGMTEDEEANLTLAMANSGDTIDLSAIEGVKVDKHSTGGVGDTTTLILAPLVASAGVPVAKMSGRGLGHTGGTIDKLESIAGFSVEAPIDEFIDLVNRHKVAVVGQSGNLTPADKKMYALRDVTATVNSIPLIAASIMSKKIAAGADAIVLDVKVGDGAFMKTVEEAQELAKHMVRIGTKVGRKTMAVISDMSQPLGRAVGNGLEVKEAIETLQGRGPQDLTELCLVLGGQMLHAAGRVESYEEGKLLLKQLIEDGSAFAKFKEFIAAQHGDTHMIDDLSLLPSAQYQIPFVAQTAGYISDWKTQEVGEVASLLGAGRATKEDIIDPAVGLIIERKIGDAVQVGDTIATIHANTPNVDEVIAMLEDAVSISDQPVQAPNLVHMFVVGQRERREYQLYK